MNEKVLMRTVGAKKNMISWQNRRSAHTKNKYHFNCHTQQFQQNNEFFFVVVVVK